MKKGLFDFLLILRITYLRKFGSDLEKIALDVSDEYYYLLKKNNIHQDIIHKIIKNYTSEKSKIEEFNKFVYSSRLASDSLLEQKYGAKSKFILNLFKLILKIYFESLPDSKKRPYNEELQFGIFNLNKNFNKIILYMFKKHFYE